MSETNFGVCEFHDQLIVKLFLHQDVDGCVKVYDILKLNHQFNHLVHGSLVLQVLVLNDLYVFSLQKLLNGLGSMAVGYTPDEVRNPEGLWAYVILTPEIFHSQLKQVKRLELSLFESHDQLVIFFLELHVVFGSIRDGKPDYVVKLLAP